MGALAPAFLAFAALAAVPVLIHLYGRPRAEKRRFAAIGFLRRSDRRTAPRRTWREIALLVARALAIAAVPLLLAKPFVLAIGDAPIAIGAGRPESAVIVIDDSRSMGFRASPGGPTLFESARKRARSLVSGLGRDSEAAVLFVGSASASPPELTSDRTRLRRSVDGARVTQRPGDSGAAIKRAAAILANAPHSEHRIYLLSDLAAHGFAGDPPPGLGAGGPALTAIDVADTPDGAPPPENRAVIEVRVEGAPQLGPRGVRVDATLANFGGAPVHDLPVTLRVDGKAAAKGLVDLPAGGRVVKRFYHVLEESRAEPAPGHAEPTGDAPHDVVVELAPDGLPDDDRRYARVQVRRELRALLIDGDPRTIRRDDEVYYLETALRPGDRDDSRIDVTVTTIDDLPRRRLDDFDVVFVANVKAPDAARAATLASFVERGGGLFLSLGDNVDPDSWNNVFGALLPQPLSSVRTVGATLRSRDDGEVRPSGEGERISRFDRRHPVLAPFTPGTAGARGHGAGEALRETRVARYVLLRPTPLAGDADDTRKVLLRLESGAPLLVESRHGAGRVLLLTTTIDRDWSDLAIQPAYLPLLQQAARYLARAALREPDAPSLCGEPRDLPLTEGDQRVEVGTPGGAIRHFDPDRVAGRRSLVFADTDEPGIYQVATGSASSPRPRPQLSFAVNVDPSESDLARVAPARLAAWTQGRSSAGPPPKRRVELWHALGALLLALLLAESLLSTRRV